MIIGLDVGGTHTDVVLLDNQGLQKEARVPTDPSDLFKLEISRILNNSFEKVFMGHRISGNLNFGRRIATAFLNASVYPLHKEFYQAVQKSLQAIGLKIPLRLLKADGGNMNFSARGYADLTAMLKPDIAVLEGGNGIPP